ncbi:hypothetical protein [Streptomyces sp. NPDC006668]|uniref:hypothetical protein n=1 Tax=Streptomyces sp. NPDC006668 TaxID=3156903 RepID=UPI0033C8AB32
MGDYLRGEEQRFFAVRVVGNAFGAAAHRTALYGAPGSPKAPVRAPPWMRRSLFSLSAAAVLALTATAVHDAAEDEPALVPLSCPELIRLLRALVLPPPVCGREQVLHWTAWRRHHQAVVTAYHQQRHHRHDQP